MKHHRGRTFPSLQEVAWDSTARELISGSSSGPSAGLSDQTP